MIRYIARRFLAVPPTLLIVAVLIALMLDFVPGDPAALMLGEEASGEAIAAKRVELGLDRPMPVRLGNWLYQAVQGNLGESYFLNESVAAAIQERYSVTISVALFSLIVAIIAGIATGLVASIRQGRPADWLAMTLSLVVLSIPAFWLALNLIFLFAVQLHWLPVGGFVPLTENPLEYFRHLLLPCVSLGLAEAAVIARMTRTSMLEVLRADYVRTARAKGLRERVVVLGHAMKNALIPIATAAGISAGVLLGGSVVTETVYNLPGVGRMVVEAVQRRDYPVVQGGILVITLTYLLINLAVDVLYTWIDPRIRYD